MTTDEALKEIQDHVQWCREEGETDLRGILSKIKYLREQLTTGAMEITPNEATIEPDTIIDGITYAVLEVVSPEGHEPEDKAQVREAIARAIDKSTTP